MKKRETEMPKTHEEVCKKKRLFMRLLGVTLDVEQRREYESAVNHCDRLTARITEKVKRLGILLLLLGVLAFAGCTSSATLGVSSSVYYPKKHESPASRRQHTQPTVGMARNNLPMVGVENDSVSFVYFTLGICNNPI